MDRMTLREMSTPLARVQAILPLLAKIRKITCSASISWGVIHEGEVLLTHTEGLRDVEQGLEADSGTAYLLASLTKGFLSALCGILVEEGILEWDAPISDYVPLQWKIDPEAGRRVTLRDVLSHSTGRAHMDLTWLGVESETIVEKRDLLQVIGHLPMKFDLRGGFHYNNYMYALAGRIVEGACGTACGNEKEEEKTWPQELRHRIFSPLGMRTTATNREDLHTSNLAEGHVVLDDKSLKKIAPTDMSDRTAIGAAGSVWSTVPDMLKWAKELLEALDSNGKKAETILRQIETIFSPKIPIEHSAQENTYAMGWIIVRNEQAAAEQFRPEISACANLAVQALYEKSL